MGFTERETEAFYDSHDGVYRSFWDSEGSLHWGLYDQDPSPDGRDYLEACLRCNEVLAAALKPIGPDSHVLDLGSGNGNSALWLARRTGARVTGVRPQRRAGRSRQCAGQAHGRGPRRIPKGIGHGVAVRGRDLHPCLEPGDALSRP